MISKSDLVFCRWIQIGSRISYYGDRKAAGIQFLLISTYLIDVSNTAVSMILLGPVSISDVSEWFKQFQLSTHQQRKYQFFVNF